VGSVTSFIQDDGTEGEEFDVPEKTTGNQELLKVLNHNKARQDNVSYIGFEQQK